jgi:tRNA pseudouridine55 synthase
MLHGWIILDKPIGLGSTTAVSAVKRILRAAGEPKTRVGHGGTLDPLASGVLPIAVGEATKLCGRMLDASKAYNFTISFGEETDTLDAEGAVVATSAVRPTLDRIEAVLPRFTGEIEQVPPAYSALKMGGKAAYARARAGEAVEMKARMVTVYSLRRSLQGHLHPKPRARHRACAWNRRAAFLSTAHARRAVRARSGHFAGLSGGSG